MRLCASYGFFCLATFSPRRGFFLVRMLRSTVCSCSCGKLCHVIVLRSLRAASPSIVVCTPLRPPCLTLVNGLHGLATAQHLQHGTSRIHTSFLQSKPNSFSLFAVSTAYKRVCVNRSCHSAACDSSRRAQQGPIPGHTGGPQIPGPGSASESDWPALYFRASQRCSFAEAGTSGAGQAL